MSAEDPTSTASTIVQETEDQKIYLGPVPIYPSDALFVLGAAIFTSLLTEGISWYLVYRHKEYQTLTQNISNLQKKVDKQKEQAIFLGAA
jgi:hypothetical protein